MHRPDKTLDIRGIAGQRARSLVSQALDPMRPGEVLKLIMTERDADRVIAGLCREQGYRLLDSFMEGPVHSFFLQR